MNSPAATLIRISTALVFLLTVYSPAYAELPDETPNIPQRVEILDPQNPEHLRLIRRFIPDEIPEGFTVKRVVEIHIDPNDDKVHERQQIIVPLDEEGRMHGTAVYHAGGYSGTQRIVQLRRGKKHGIEKIYRRINGNFFVCEEISWEDGEIHGERKMYHPGGSINIISTFNKGVPEGERKTFSPEGKLLEVVSYKDGRMHGERLQYWDGSDQVRRIVPYDMGTVHGIVRDYHQNGQLRREMPYRNAMLHGIEKQFDEEGKLTRERYWLNDEPVARGRFEQEFDEE